MKSDRPAIDRCNICGEVKLLSEDHVPPKFWNNKALKRYSVAFGTKDPEGAKNFFPYKDRNGITYKSICNECNNKLGGSYDKELKTFCDELSRSMKSPLCIPLISVSISPDRVAHAVVGHMLAAKNFYDDDCVVDKDLRKYVADENALPPEGMHLYCYPYFHDYIVIGRDMVTVGKNVPESMISMISAFPVAFILTDKIYPGLKDIFALCTGDCSTVSNVVVSLTTACENGTKLLRHPFWPANIGQDVYGVLSGTTMNSMIIAKGER